MSLKKFRSFHSGTMLSEISITPQRIHRNRLSDTEMDIYLLHKIMAPNTQFSSNYTSPTGRKGNQDYWHVRSTDEALRYGAAETSMRVGS